MHQERIVAAQELPVQALSSDNLGPQIPSLDIAQSSADDPLEIWVSEELFHPEEKRPVPLLMSSYKFDKAPQLLFWNLLRESLPDKVKVHFFKNIEDAGPLVVTPHDAKEHMFIKKVGELRDYNRKILATGRRVVTFAGGMEYKPLPGEIVFATSVYRNDKTGLIPLPTWIYDIGAEITPIQKPSTPTIAFDGNTTYSGLISTLSDFVPLPDSVLNWLACNQAIGQLCGLRVRRVIPRHLRRRVLKAARQAPELKTAFKERDDFFVLSFEERQRNRAEYLKSIQENAYTFSIRGDANGDFRMYEVMSAGRLPIIIDTNLKLPALGNGLKWEDFCVIVPYSKLNQMGKIVREFHDNLSDDEFQAACRKSREAFDYLLPHNYLDNIIATIRERVATAKV